METEERLKRELTKRNRERARERVPICVRGARSLALGLRRTELKAIKL